MELGSWMARLARDEGAEEALVALDNLALFAEVRNVGLRYGEEPAEYIASAAGRFATIAESEDWLALMNAVERSPDPTRAALERMLRWALDRDIEEEKRALEPAGAGGCSCGGGGGCHGHS